MHPTSRKVAALSDTQLCSSPSASQKKLLVPGAFRDSQSPEPSPHELQNEEKTQSRHTESVVDDSSNDVRLETASCRPSKNPTTPTRRSAKPSRAPASDPGPRTRARETLSHDRSPIPRATRETLCGITYSRMSCYHKHQSTCQKCQEMRHASTEKSTEQNCSIPDLGDVSGQQSSDTPRSSNGDTDNDDTSRAEEEVDPSSEETRPRPGKPDHVISWDLHSRLKSKLKKRESAGEGNGVIYFLEVPEKPGIVKLGFTKDEFERGKQHKQKCRLKTTYAYSPIQFAKVKIAEKFLKIELDHLKAPWYCNHCCQEHEEWFSVDVKQVAQLAWRWRRWINEEAPYTERGTLKESWEWFIEHEMPEGEFDEFTHEARWAHWSRILAHTSKAVDELWRCSEQKHPYGKPLSRKSTARLRYDEPAMMEIIIVLLLIWACLKFSDMA